MVHSVASGIAAQGFSRLSKDSQSPQPDHTKIQYCYSAEGLRVCAIESQKSDLVTGLALVYVQGHLQLFILLCGLIPLGLQF